MVRLQISGSQPVCLERFPRAPQNFLKNICPLLRNLFLVDMIFQGRKARNPRQIQSEDLFLENSTLSTKIKICTLV